MTDQEYKREFALLTERLGRTPTPRDKEWLELTERHRKGWMDHAAGLSNETSSGRTVRLGTEVRPTRSEDGATRNGLEAVPGGYRREVLKQRRRPVQEGGTSAGGSPVPNAREGRGEALYGPGITQSGSGGLDSLSAPSAPKSNSDGAIVGGRGPSGGIYAKCDGCGRVWERERKRGRPARMCGECK